MFALCSDIQQTFNYRSENFEAQGNIDTQSKILTLAERMVSVLHSSDGDETWIDRVID